MRFTRAIEPLIARRQTATAAAKALVEIRKDPTTLGISSNVTDNILRVGLIYGSAAHTDQPHNRSNGNPRLFAWGFSFARDASISPLPLIKSTFLTGPMK
jgi:hypothetical protein